MGGTFVDCSVVTANGLVVEAKAPTTPAAPVDGILASIHGAASILGIETADMLGRAGAIVHGTTLGLNALIGGDVGRVALLATRGHEDAILIGRVHQKVAGLRPHEMTRITELRKPEPLVPRWRIHGIHERVDAAGRVVVPLDERGVLEAADAAVEDGCEAIAVAFLWSFLNPDHERRAAGLIVEAHPNVPVVTSSEVAGVLGEYERTAAAAVNAALLRPLAGYLDRLLGALADAGFRGRLWAMGMAGGLIASDVAARRPVEILRSGPVGGIVAARELGRRMGAGDLITTDMGGTSFDVGVLTAGEPDQADVTIAGRLHLAVPGIDVRSIGAGGGSIAWVDPHGGLHVGPQSAGANPGPACYGLGGTEATVTDADVVLGRLDPDAILGGAIRIDAAAAHAAVDRVAERLGLGVEEAAAGIVRVAGGQMADLIRAVTVEHGRDPRAMVLIAFGGAGPLHVGGYAPDVGVRAAIIPASASVLSAWGLAIADHRRLYRRSRRLQVPIDQAVVTDLVAEMATEARRDFEASALLGSLGLSPWMDLRYRRQTHQLRIPIGTVGALGLAGLATAFAARYVEVFGEGSGYAAAGIEATAVGLTAIGRRAVGSSDASPRRLMTLPGHRPRTRRVWFERWVDETPVVDAATLAGGSTVAGPAVLEWPATTLLVHPGQTATMDTTGAARLVFGAAG